LNRDALPRARRKISPSAADVLERVLPKSS
jgi:hypothetical protein